MTRRLEGGRYYGRTLSGHLVPVGDVDRPPDEVVCRRVADYAPAPIPAGAAFGVCGRCDAAIAFNPNGPHPTAPKLCMQCAGIQPNPIVSG